MKLPVQAPAVVRGSVSWPTRPARGGTEPAIEPAQTNNLVIQCPPGMNACVCDNGVAVCCDSTMTYCQTDPNTGFCSCKSEGP
jgi:hypothetical protein